MKLLVAIQILNKRLFCYIMTVYMGEGDVETSEQLMIYVDDPFRMKTYTQHIQIFFVRRLSCSVLKLS